MTEVAEMADVVEVDEATSNTSSTSESVESQDALAADSVVLVRGEPFVQLPADLYIPPDALEVFLETFSGPLDLLLYLIRHQNLDILNIPIAKVTEQYMEYIDLMQVNRFELAAEYLVMAATLAEIKSRMLLPRPESEDEEGVDPRAELVRRLQEYERFKMAAESLDALPRLGREMFSALAMMPEVEEDVKAPPQVNLDDLLHAMQAVMQRAEWYAHHNIAKEPLSIRERMTMVLHALQEKKFVVFQEMFTIEEGRRGVVVTFMAILELVKQSMIDIVQAAPFQPIHVRARA